MKDKEQAAEAIPIPLSAQPLLSLDKYLLMSGLSAATGWRYRCKGWLKTVNIAGRHYITREAIADFNRRAEAGEFSKAPRNPGRRSTAKS